MTKWLVSLLLGIYLVFQLGGDDPTKLRPGLVNAGVDPSDFPKAVVEPVETRTLTATGEAITPKAPSSVGETLATAMVAAPKGAAPKANVVAVAYSPEPAPAEGLRQPDKVFTLSVLPGQENAPAVSEVAPKAAVATAEAQVWYVTGRSVNVRLDPSRDAPIVGKLNRGDATLMLADNGAGWAMVSVEGDGVSGYVSMDFLSQEAP